MHLCIFYIQQQIAPFTFIKWPILLFVLFVHCVFAIVTIIFMYKNVILYG